jgi:hypothetical protein
MDTSHLLLLALLLGGAVRDVPPQASAALDTLLAESDVVVEATVSEIPAGFVNEFRVSWLFRVNKIVLLLGTENLGEEVPIATETMEIPPNLSPEPPAKLGDRLILFLRRPAPSRPHEENPYVIVGGSSGIRMYSAELKKAVGVHRRRAGSPCWD